MVRVIVCCGAMIGFIIGARWVLRGALDSWGLGWGTLACVAFGGMFLVIAYLIDRADSRSQEVLPPKPRDYR